VAQRDAGLELRDLISQVNRALGTSASLREQIDALAKTAA